MICTEYCTHHKCYFPFDVRVDECTENHIPHTTPSSRRGYQVYAINWVIAFPKNCGPNWGTSTILTLHAYDVHVDLTRCLNTVDHSNQRHAARIFRTGMRYGVCCPRMKPFVLPYCTISTTAVSVLIVHPREDTLGTHHMRHRV